MCSENLNEMWMLLTQPGSPLEIGDTKEEDQSRNKANDGEFSTLHGITLLDS